MQILLGITQFHPVEGLPQYRNRKELKPVGQIYQQDSKISMRLIEDNCSPTNQLNISRPQKYHLWQQDKDAYEEAAKTLEETSVFDSLCQSTLR